MKAELARTGAPSDGSVPFLLVYALLGGDEMNSVAWNLKARKLPKASDVATVAGRALASTLVIGTVAKLAGASFQKSFSIGAIVTAGVDAALLARLYQRA